LRISLEVYIYSSDRRLVESIYKALRPDNVDIPDKLKLRMEYASDHIYLAVESQHPYVVKSTLDDIFRCISGIAELCGGDE
jgi:tRNA threonylcarbamoyladenosine modification (KEOPS) complex  Pcc1 subunit